MTRNRDLPEVIKNIPGFFDGERPLIELHTDERWKALLHFAHNAPGLAAIAYLYELEQAGRITGVYGDYLALIVDKLAELTERALKGEEQALLQIQAAHRMLCAETFGLEIPHIKQVAEMDKTKSGKDAAALSRAYDVRIWMSRLSSVVEPKKQGERLSPLSAVKLREKPIYEGDADLMQMVRERFMHKNTSLQSLAIDIYLDMLEKAGVTTKSYGAIDKDLQIAKKYDKEYSPNNSVWQLRYVHGGDPLPVKILAHSWATRKKSDSKNSL
jgi:hypothetical protein